jgi:predicted small lipoprotein YifL
VTGSVHLRLAHLAAVGALLGALALGACGRKGPLDLPPSASVTQPEPPPGDAPDPMFSGYARPPQPEPAKPPVTAQPAEKKRFLLDWLL